MEVSTAITLLTINVIILSLVIIVIIIAATVLIVKLNKVAKNVEATTAHLASITEWFSPVKVFSAMTHAFKSLRKRK